MQVNVHSIDRTEVTDFTESGEEDCPPFVAIKIFDGQGGEVAFLLREYADIQRLVGAVLEARARLWLIH